MVNPSELSQNKSLNFPSIFKGPKSTVFLQRISAVCLALLAGFRLASFSSPLVTSASFGMFIGTTMLHAFAHQRTCLPALNDVSRKLVDQCEGFPTENCAETEVYRNALIDAAQENIVISANVCGGTAFSALLERLEKRMTENKKLKVVIIGASRYISDTQKEKICRISKEFPDRFSFIFSSAKDSPIPILTSPQNTPEAILFNETTQTLKASTNHAKGVVIDSGRFFILGGSGIKNNFTQTGLDKLSKEQFLKSKNLPVCKDNFEEDDEYSKRMFGDFRDMDFVFHSNGQSQCGERVYRQMLTICRHWEEYNKRLVSKEPSEVVRRLLSEERSTLKDYQIKEFSESQKVETVDFSSFISGPESTEKVFADELKMRIEKAQNEIIIDHMYFHPTQEIIDALVKAVIERNVEIKIITSGDTANCAKGHKWFVLRNKDHYASLVRALPNEHREKVEVYEFDQNKKSLHKKVIVFDEEIVLGGSDNDGYKSLVILSDHELDFVVKSKGFAKQTKNICKVDMDHSRLVKEPHKISVCERIQAFCLHAIAHIIG